MIRFKISFRKKIPENRRNVILDNLISNLSGSSYYYFEKIGDDKLLIHGDFLKLRINNSPLDLWRGFSKRAEVYIENNEIVYSLDYTLAVVSSSVLFLFLTIIFIPPLFKSGDSSTFTIYLLCFILIYLIGLIIYRIILHRNLVIYTLKYGSRFTGKYDWEKILRSKPFEELKNIANGNTTLPQEVQELARKEMVRRRDNK